jgi:hypothetical protein
LTARAEATSRLLEHDAGELVHDADLVEVTADRAEQPGPDGQVEDPDGLLGVRAVLEQVVQAVPVVGMLGVEHQVVEAAEQTVDDGVVEIVGGDVRRQGHAHCSAVAVVVELGAGHPDDPGVVGQLALEFAEIERRQQFAQRQVSRPAEDGEVARGGHRGRGDVLGHGSTVGTSLDRYKYY